MRFPVDVRLRVYGVLSDEITTVIEVLCSRAEAEEVVTGWDRDEPEVAGKLQVVPVELTLEED